VKVTVVDGYYGDGYGGGSVNSTAVPAILSFLAQPNDPPKHATVAVMASNTGARKSFSASSEAPWLSVSPSSGTMPQILSVIADPSGLQPATYSTHIDVTANQTANGGARIPVTFTIQEVVPFNVDPAAVAVRLPLCTGTQTTPQEATLILTSAQSMTYHATGVAGDQTGTTPGQLTLSLGSCGYPGLSDGGYVNITTSGNNVVDVPVAYMAPGLVPLIEPGGIVNGATFAQGPVAPGSIASVFGVDLADSEYVTTSTPLPGGPPFGQGVSQIPYGYVAPDDEYGYFYEGPLQWNIQIPATLQPGTYWLTIGSSGPVSFTVAPTAPYIFIWGSNHGAVQNEDYSQNTPQNPAAAGSVVLVYLTGQGAVNPPVPTRFAAPSSPLSKTVAATTATIDGSPTNVDFSGLAPGLVGLAQVNLDIPAGLPAGEHTLVIDIGGVQSNAVILDTK
jgi:uncharacterized protein (TIGR03437 family)